jgi:hypothetical protein
MGILPGEWEDFLRSIRIDGFIMPTAISRVIDRVPEAKDMAAVAALEARHAFLEAIGNGDGVIVAKRVSRSLEKLAQAFWAAAEEFGKEKIGQ